MANTEPTATGGVHPGRRTIVKGAAWAVPAVAIASAAPAMAASPEPGLNGWVVISRESGWWSCQLRYDGYRNGDDYYDGVRLGLWVWDATIADITTAPSLTIHLPYQVTWSTATGNSGWPAPNYVGQGADGRYMYRSVYQGSYTQGSDGQGRPEVILNGRPHFIGTHSSSCPSNRYQAITRSVGVRGETIAFKREVNFPSSNPNLQQAPQTPPASGADTAAVTASPNDASAGPADQAPVPDAESQQAVETPIYFLG